MHQFTEMGECFYKITSLIFTQLRKDTHLDKTREEMLPFISAMEPAITCVRESLYAAKGFYISQDDEFRPHTWGRDVTDEDTRKLFDPSRQAKILSHALEVV
jgi:hypothetical protein